jgi:two-component system NtrC family sensor kinase
MNVIDAIEAAINLMEHQDSSGRVRIRRNYAIALPQVVADENQLQQVYFNIIRNAYQAMPNGGMLLITGAVEGKDVVTTFTDSGPGIAQEHLRHIFDPFFTTKEVGQGTGLGLSVSYGIVRQHGGTIEASSQEGSGATFTVRLPAAETSREWIRV